MPVLAWITARVNALAIVLLGVLLLAVLVAWKLNGARLAAERRAQSADERAHLAVKDLPVAELVDVKALQREAAELRRSNQSLASAYSAELAEVHELRAVLVAHGSTGPVIAHGIPREGPEGSGGGEVPKAIAPPPEVVRQGRILLVEGDTAEIPVAIEVDRTDKRNLLLNVTASAVRLFPAPKEEIIPTSIVRQQSIHVDPDLVQGPTVTKTRWWAVGLAAGTGFAAGAATCRVGR